MTKHDDTATNNEELEEQDHKEPEVEIEDELEKKLEESENKYRRALADYQNLEKRVLEDRREWIKSANRDLLNRLLPILDTLTLANKHEEHESLKVSIRQFLDTLKSEGVVKVETEGQDFDANTMEAVGMQEGTEGKVLEEVRTGFMLHDRLLRPAQVIVGSGKGK